jgi:hypothetical protein
LGFESVKGDPSPDAVDQASYFPGYDFFEDWHPQDFELDMKTIPSQFLPEYNQQSPLSNFSSSRSSSHFVSPWPEDPCPESLGDNCMGPQSEEILGAKRRNKVSILTFSA